MRPAVAIRVLWLALALYVLTRMVLDVPLRYLDVVFAAWLGGLVSLACWQSLRDAHNTSLRGLNRRPWRHVEIVRAPDPPPGLMFPDLQDRAARRDDGHGVHDV